MLQPMPERWEVEVPAHTAAVTEFIDVARGITAPRWEEPLAPGKWTPAEVAAHVTEVYAVLRRELAGGAGMTLRGVAVQRWIMRRLILPRLLRGGSFPPGVRAPAETRPVTVVADQTLALTTFQQAANQFIKELDAKRAGGPVSLTHAYFGRGPGLHGLRMVTMHLRHHTKQIAAVSR